MTERRLEVGGGPSASPAFAAAREIPLLDYTIHVAPGALDTLADVVAAAAPAHRYAVVADTNVAPRYAPRVRTALGSGRATLYEIPAGEAHKTRETWAALTDRLLADGFGRDTTIIALGGGVVGDLAGFVAATYMRGVPYVQVPTSLLAMVDASIGGKTGVDTPAGKNLVGAFHQPAAVVVDPTVLRTLPLAHLRAGLAEALKHGVIADAAHFAEVAALAIGPTPADDEVALADVIVHSIAIKADVVRRDTRESGVRKTLNFGHTLGHAVESESGYALLHGEAVAIGMVLEARLAERLGIAAAGTAARVTEAVRTLGLPSARPADQAPERILAATRSDKKARAGVVEYALPSRVGAMAGEERGWGTRVPDDAVLEVLA